MMKNVFIPSLEALNDIMSQVGNNLWIYLITNSIYQMEKDVIFSHV